MRDPNKPVPRGVYILPNLFTTASLFAGFLSITLAISGDFDNAAWAILFSALMDGLDGKVARLTGSASQFGVEFKRRYAMSPLMYRRCAREKNV